MSVLDGVAQWAVGPNPVGIAAAFPLPFQVAGVNQVTDDSLGGPFGDTHPLGHIAQTQSRVAGDTDQRVGVVG